MIVVDHQSNRVRQRLREFTLADYKEFEEVVNYRSSSRGRWISFRPAPDGRFHPGPGLGGEIKFSRAHATISTALRVVTDSQWVTWSAWLSQTLRRCRRRGVLRGRQAKAWLEAGA